MAQLVARLVRNEKVGGSNPPSSTTIEFCPAEMIGGAELYLRGLIGVTVVPRPVETAMTRPSIKNWSPMRRAAT